MLRKKVYLFSCLWSNVRNHRFSRGNVLLKNLFVWFFKARNLIKEG